MDNGDNDFIKIIGVYDKRSEALQDPEWISFKQDKNVFSIDGYANTRLVKCEPSYLPIIEDKHVNVRYTKKKSMAIYEYKIINE